MIQDLHVIAQKSNGNHVNADFENTNCKCVVPQFCSALSNLWVWVLFSLDNGLKLAFTKYIHVHVSFVFLRTCLKKIYWCFVLH